MAVPASCDRFIGGRVGGHKQILAHGFNTPAIQRERFWMGSKRLSKEHGHRVSITQNLRGDEEMKLVHNSGPESAAVGGAASFDQEALNLSFGEFFQNPSPVRRWRTGILQACQYLHSPLLQGPTPGVRRRG